MSILSHLKCKNRYPLCITLLTVTLVLTGCTPQVMRPIHYEKPINAHIEKNVILQWKNGEHYDAIKAIQTGPGLIEACAGGLSESLMREHYPELYHFTYGKQQQAIFMKSLHDVLCQQNVFKTVQIDEKTSCKIKPNDVLIHVFFKSSRASTAHETGSLSLKVDLTIQSNYKPLFKKSYFVNCAGGYFPTQAQEAVSKQLFEKVIAGIEEWHAS